MKKILPYTSNTRIKSLLFILLGIVCANFTFAQTKEVVINKALWSTNNLIKNWNFNVDLTSWGNWIDMAVPGQQFPIVENGVVKMTTGKASDGNYWHYQFNQLYLEAEANIPYLLKFKSWSSIPKSNRVDFEDSPPFNDYIRYGASSDAQAIDGRSEWQYNTTTEPQWFTFHVVFDQIKPTTVQKIQWMLSNASAVTYLDSILLIKQEDTIETVPHFLTLSTTQIGLEAGEGTAMVDIASDVSWIASSNQPWLKLSSTAGTGNRSLILTVQANTLTNARKSTITIKADGTTTQTITVTQSSKPIPPGDHGQPTCGQKWSDETWNYQNLIRNWNFTTDLTYWGGWIDNLGPWQEPPTTKNGVAVMTSALAADGNNWHYQFSQNGLQAEANVPYLLKFKSWSSTPRSNGLLFEDTPQNNYTRYGASNDPEAIGGRSEWTYYTTIQPRWYTFHVVFDRIVPSTLQKIQWMLSTADATTYLDSVILIKGGDSIVANDDYLILSKNTLFLEEKAASASFTITSNAEWEIRSDQPWLSVDHTTGSGNQTITLTAPANTLYTNRMATATIYVPGLKAQTISVIQNARQSLPVDPGDSNLTEYWSSDAWNDYNLIKNWNFTSGLTDWGWWVDGAIAGQLEPTVVNGTAAMTTFVSPDGNSWHYQLHQYALQAVANVPYTLKFKSWSTLPRTNVLVFEDSPQNNYNRYGASTDAESLNGRSEWYYFTTTQPRWYTFHVVFDQMTASTEQKIQWMLSTAGATSYLDSIILIKDSDLLMVKEAQLALSANHLEVDCTETQATVDVSSNTNSLAISDQNWLTIYPPLVTGNKTIQIATQANPTTQVRSATVTLYPAGMKSKTITVTQASITGIKTTRGDQKLSIFPNPTTGKIKCVMDRAPQKGTYLTVVDVSGKTILNQLIQGKEQSIDLKGNPPGVYFIYTGLKDSKVQKIVLTR